MYVCMFVSMWTNIYVSKCIINMYTLMSGAPIGYWFVEYFDRLAAIRYKIYCPGYVCMYLCACVYQNRATLLIICLM